MRTILAWKESLGGRVPITSERVEYIMDLFKSLEANGFTMEEILSERNTLRIINACVNPTSKKKEAWAKSVRFNFETAVGRYFPPTLARCTDEEKNKVAQVDTSNHVPVPKKPEVEYEKIEWKGLELPDPSTIPDTTRDPEMEELFRFE